MSRFDRRLKSSGGGGSPRPGTATCKIRTNKPKILSGFINVQEKNVRKNVVTDENSSNLIQEISSKSLVKNVDIIDKTIETNEKLKKVIAATRDPNMKRLLYHELRLNTIEVNLDCLTDIKCVEVNQNQKTTEETYNLETINKKVMSYDDSISKIVTDNNHINNKLEQNESIVNNIKEEVNTKITDSTNVIFERINNLEESIDKLKDNNEKNNDDGNVNERVDYLEQQNNILKEKLSVYEDKFRILLERLSHNNPEYQDMIVH